MIRYNQWCDATHGHRMMADEKGIFVLASDHDAKVAQDKATIDDLIAQLAVMGEALNVFGNLYDHKTQMFIGDPLTDDRIDVGNFATIRLGDLIRAREALTNLPLRVAKLLAVVEAAKKVRKVEKHVTRHDYDIGTTETWWEGVNELCESIRALEE